MQLTDFLDWGTLATFSGATAAVTVVTQLLKKPVDSAVRLPTRVLSYITALLVLLAATFFTGGRAPGDYVICIINAALVSLASNGSFDLVKSIRCGVCESTEEKGGDGDDDNA